MTIGLGSDHNGFALKQRLRSFLAEHGEKVRDFGTFSHEPIDYPALPWRWRKQRKQV